VTTHELNFTVRRGSVSAVYDDGSTADPADSPQNALDHDLIQMIARMLADPRRSWQARDIKIFGSMLFRFLFAGEAGDFLDRKVGSLAGDDTLRILLAFHDDMAHLSSIPWEYLYVPDSANQAGYHLATDSRVVLARRMPLKQARTPLTTGERVRLLVVVSQPPSLGTVIAEPILNTLKALEKERQGDIEVTVLKQPTFDRLTDTLKQVQPALLHFIGHGEFDERRGIGRIALERDPDLDDNPDDPWWCNDNDFADIFRRGPKATPRIVILHSCEGATTDRNVRFAGMAPHLIRAGVQACVAMQYEVTNHTAVTFSKVLYSEVLRGRPLDRAVQEARWRATGVGLGEPDARLLGIPVLYFNSLDAVIVPPFAAGDQ
jgi:CHAT domain